MWYNGRRRTQHGTAIKAQAETKAMLDSGRMGVSFLD
jgi:hypothetical protein